MGVVLISLDNLPNYFAFTGWTCLSQLLEWVSVAYLNFWSGCPYTVGLLIVHNASAKQNLVLGPAYGCNLQVPCNKNWRFFAVMPVVESVLPLWSRSRDRCWHWCGELSWRCNVGPWGEQVDWTHTRRGLPESFWTTVYILEYAMTIICGFLIGVYPPSIFRSSRSEAELRGMHRPALHALTERLGCPTLLCFWKESVSSFNLAI